MVKGLIAFLVLCLWHNTVNSQTIREWKDVNYAGDTLTGHLMDIYLPDEGSGPFPVIVCIAGSAWFANNSKSRAYQIGKHMRNYGFAIVAINHRSSREAIFPAQINDVKAAVRFLRANTGKYHLDTDFIGITGDSSGGHLSALMASTNGTAGKTEGEFSVHLEGNIGFHINESSIVDAVVDWYGPTTFTVMDECGSSFSHDAPDSPESTLIGGPIQENKEFCKLADPITYVDSGDPPFLILHGNADPLVPHCQSELLYQALQAENVPSKLIIVKGGGHGQGMWEDAYIGEMVGFFIEELKRKMEK